MVTQQEILQKIADHLFTAVNEDWSEIVVQFKVDDVQSEEKNTYFVNGASGTVEKSVPFVPELGRFLRELRKHVAGEEREMFSQCRLQFSSNGEFDVKYGYDPINWSILDRDSSFDGS